MQVNSLRHVSSANGLFLEEEKEEKAEEEYLVPVPPKNVLPTASLQSEVTQTVKSKEPVVQTTKPSRSLGGSESKAKKPNQSPISISIHPSPRSVPTLSG